MEFHRVPRTDRYFIFVSTLDRLYYFTGNSCPEDKPLLQRIFSSYLNMKEKFHTIPSKIKYSSLRFWYDQQSPKSFGWLTEQGIFFGELTLSTLESFDSLIKSCELIRYPKPAYEETASKPPTAFALTEFHALMNYGDTVKGVSVLNSDLIFEDVYNESFGKLINIVKDPIKGTVWAVTEKAIFRYKIVKEERNVWEIFCAKGKFDLAKHYSAENPAHYDQVLVKEANMLFDQKQ